jgi:transcriptional regulator with XRE-family HTH domain
MDYIEKIGQRIFGIRKIKKITQERLAEKSDLTVSYISKIEAGKRNPSLITIEKIATGLGVEIYQLFTNTEPELMSDKIILDKIEELVITLRERSKL